MEVKPRAFDYDDDRVQSEPRRFLTSPLTSPWTPALTLADSMDQLSQRSSSSRTQFMSREDLDQEGSLDLEHEHYQDQDPDQSLDQDLEHHQAEEHDQRDISLSIKTLEVKVGTCTKASTIHAHWSHAMKTQLDRII